MWIAKNCLATYSKVRDFPTKHTSTCHPSGRDYFSPRESYGQSSPSGYQGLTKPRPTQSITLPGSDVCHLHQFPRSTALSARPLGFSLEWYYFGRRMLPLHSPAHSHEALATTSIVASNLQVLSTHFKVFPHSEVMRTVHEHNHRHPAPVTVVAYDSLTNRSRQGTHEEL